MDGIACVSRDAASCSYPVVNLFDITIRVRAAAVPEVDIPEGNGSGTWWIRF
jgi:hypothetical protein